MKDTVSAIADYVCGIRKFYFYEPELGRITSDISPGDSVTITITKDNHGTSN